MLTWSPPPEARECMLMCGPAVCGHTVIDVQNLTLVTSTLSPRMPHAEHGIAWGPDPADQDRAQVVAW